MEKNIIKWVTGFVIALIVIMAPAGNANAIPIPLQDSTHQESSNSPLYIVDKKILKYENEDELYYKLDRLLPIIESIIVSKEAGVISKYGEKGKNGVIILKLIKGKRKRKKAIANWKKDNPEWPNEKRKPIPPNTIMLR